MEEETIEHLVEEKRRRFKRNMSIIITVFIILALLNILFLMILGLILMLVGATTSLNTGSAMMKWKYYANVTSGFHEDVKIEKKERRTNFNLGILLSLIGLALFLLSLYLASMGWTGVISL